MNRLKRFAYTSAMWFAIIGICCTGPTALFAVFIGDLAAAKRFGFYTVTSSWFAFWMHAELRIMRICRFVQEWADETQDGLAKRGEKECP